MPKKLNNFDVLEKKIRPLTGRELKELKAEGITFGRPDPDQDADEVIDRALGVVLSPEELAAVDDLPYTDKLTLNRQLLQKTYGLEEEVKN